MTAITTLPEPEPTPAGGSSRKLLATVIGILVVLGIGAVVVAWWRRGGARRALTGLAEDGAVRLADAIVDEVLGAA